MRVGLFLLWLDIVIAAADIIFGSPILMVKEILWPMIHTMGDMRYLLTKIAKIPTHYTY